MAGASPTQSSGRGTTGAATGARAAGAGAAGRQRRAALLQAAIELFSQRPYDQVSVADIAAHAGVATGLLYYHFTDKQGLYAAGLEQVAAQLERHIDAAIDPDATPLEQVLATLDAHLAFVSEHPTGYRELLRGAAAQPRVAALVERERGKRLELMIAGLPEGVQPTAIVRATMEGWLHFVDGVLLAWLRDGGLDRGQLGALCARILFAGVLAAIEVQRGDGAQTHDAGAA
ncbi:MAG: TetR/AcrR family transcriptional regulator [Solirubrobacteraceae bacterium]